MTENKRKLIVVDDDKDICNLLKDFMTQNGYIVDTVSNAEQLLTLLDQEIEISLIILDIMLPDLNGLEVCKKIRERNNIPILMLTAVSDTTDRILGLEFGADDYLTKPFNPRELLARIKAVLRRTEDRSFIQSAGADKKNRHFLEFSGWVLDTTTRSLLSPEKIDVPLTGKAYDLLLLFLEHPQRVLSRDQILDILSNRSAEPFDRSIDVQVSRLRQTLGDNQKEPRFIKTIRNGGYLFAATVTKM